MPDPGIRTGLAIYGAYNIAQPNSAPPEGTSPLLGRAHVSHDGHSVELAEGAQPERGRLVDGHLWPTDC
ncbi:uncharacterized protein CLUP02_15531 [Colletotrichum lupini]|uniref:Uncharacterized protein n=1 Tax=Colletotrichum lupini TaxID=145971 RepID=A0A9Q8T6Q5_9PEZI|nr:uncharacterized protein CLUP02_15531 [Colletotrichum lupini]UQC90000.1 hypothetical protein CLUP02_15531 [Colletotrichum lupini]